ncbi:TPA: hypothetical protein N0F65_002203 [Lagenidium giganteum]|uniref:Hexose transporter 1 n=1 Tax=Lagenidium giganteum TaxID=4803 RepID=A0AAV2YM37_9STRA|nr:TPA: hypothetical protein N0F65_002203 [Lagenidium giganteum]
MHRDDDIKEKLLPTTVAPEGVDHVPRMKQEVGALPRVDDSRYSSGQLQLAAWLISIASFLWGYGVSVLNVCIVPDAKGSMLVDINMSTEEQETATALVLIGAALSAMLTGGISEKLGQRKAILVNNMFFIIGGAACALAVSKKAVFFGRFSIGIACGIVTNNAPILLNEISPAHIRGRITSYHQLNITLGMLVTSVLGYFVIEGVPSGWRYMNGFIAVPAIVQCVVSTLIPESPWWLMKNKGREESRASLVYLRDNPNRDDIDAELSEITHDLESRADKGHGQWKDLRLHKLPMVIGCMLVFFQAMTGINTVMLYSAKIFHSAGITNPLFATAAVSVTNVLTTIVSIHLIDTQGRRPLLLAGVSTMVVSLAMLSFSLLYLNKNRGAQGMIAVCSVLAFVAGFAISLGAAVWVVLVDITPVQIRSRAFAVFMGINYLCNILVATYTLSAISFLGRGPNPEKDGIAKLYLICSGIALLSLLFVFCFVAETKEARRKSNYRVPVDESRKTVEGNRLLTTEKDDPNPSNVTEL